jgi:hypothetical protein
MPSRKQRRRREKLQRHEYEYVIETEEGEEIPVERPPERERPEEKGSARSRGGGARRPGGRTVPKPSLGRVLRRTAIFGPLILVVVYLTSGKDVSTAARVYTAITLLAFFIPFSYLVDVLMYRMFTKRQQRSGN